MSLGTGGKDEDGKPVEFAVKVGDTVLISKDGKPVEFAVKVGDTVLISKYGGTDVKVDGEDLLILSESDILGIRHRRLTLPGGRSPECP